MATLNQIKHVGKRSARRVGRGQSSGAGKTSGRGTKGQNARAGRKKRPELRDIIKKLPKRRGYGKNRGRTHTFRPDAVALSIARLEKIFGASETISRTTLIEKGIIIARAKNPVKIVGNTASKKLTISGVAVSASAKAAIEKAGGSIASLDVAKTK